MASTGAPSPAPTLEVRDVVRRFDEREALRGVSLALGPGDIHALLGRNGAGKTTLLRILTGLVDPSAGEVRVLGLDTRRDAGRLRGRVALVPSGDRTFYLRISALENLVFFGRLHGLRRAAAARRARELLELVGLSDAARQPVGRHSHGMQKRLSFARALITEPDLLLVDEATHDLDPEGAHRVRELAAQVAARGAAVVWATQRVDEIRGFATGVTLLDRGRVLFEGSVPELLARGAGSPRYVLRVRNGHPTEAPPLVTLRRLVGRTATVSALSGDHSDHVLLEPREEGALGEAIAALAQGGCQVLACAQERSEVEEAFLALTSRADG